MTCLKGFHIHHSLLLLLFFSRSNFNFKTNDNNKFFKKKIQIWFPKRLLKIVKYDYIAMLHILYIVFKITPKMHSNAYSFTWKIYWVFVSYHVAVCNFYFPCFFSFVNCGHFVSLLYMQVSPFRMDAFPCKGNVNFVLYLMNYLFSWTYLCWCSWILIICFPLCLCSQVYMAREIKTGEIVALKRIRMENEREGVLLLLLLFFSLMCVCFLIVVCQKVSWTM